MPKLPIRRKAKTVAAMVRDRARQVSRTMRARAACAFMDKKFPGGWRKRMELKEHWLDRDLPGRWCRGDRVPTWRTLRRLEEYAARFGYEMPPTHPEYLRFEQPVYLPDVRDQLNSISS